MGTSVVYNRKEFNWTSPNPKIKSSVDLDRRAFRRRKAFQFVVAKPQSLYLSRIAIATVNLSNYGVLEGEE